jgi:hypothetical protein
MGYARLNRAQSAMLYGRTHAFLFEGGKLMGVRISRTVLDWKLSQFMAEPGGYEGMPWKLNNGIEQDSSLKTVREILGPSLLQDRFRQYYYLTKRARVELESSHFTNEGDSDEAYQLHGILVRAK